MAAPSLHDLLATGQVWRSSAAAPATPTWSLAALAGRYVELAARGPAARLTIAGTLVLEAQLAGEPAAWITDPASHFFPPDLAHNGIDLEALVVVRAPGALAMLRAADTLLRAGAFGLVVVDLAGPADASTVPLPAQTRLVGLAQHHHTLLLCLTDPGERGPHAFASLRVEASLVRSGSARFESRLEAVKDKRGPPGWRHVVPCCTPPGLG